VLTTYAAPKKIAVKSVSVFAEVPGAEAVIVTESNIITVANTYGQSADIEVRALDFSGVQVWSKTIDSGQDEVATVFTSDAKGSIWLAGNSASAMAIDTQTSVSVDLNPDGVNIENPMPLRPDLNNLTLWQVSANGEIILATSELQSVPVLVEAISVSSSGASILITRDSKQLIIPVVANKFGKAFTIGTTKTQLTAVVRAKSGTTYAFGSSTETLSGKKLMGIQDGILLKFSKIGKLNKVVRSSAAKSRREWQSATSSLFLAGSIKTGSSVQSTLTKFTKKFAPRWTTRITSSGRTLVVSGANGSVYAILEAKSLVDGIRGWKPVKGQSLIVQFDSKGKTMNAYTSPELGVVMAAGFSDSAGLFILTEDERIWKINES
tara:strand:+ start:10150 stop:11286 length:1137 start_codon:yes stop_codon:yes gene_type:complete